MNAQARTILLPLILCVSGCGGKVVELTTDSQAKEEPDAAPIAVPDAPPDSNSLECPEVLMGNEGESELAGCGGPCVTAGCSTGPCSPEVAIETGVAVLAITVDQDYLYFSNRSDGVIRRAHLPTGAIESLVEIQGFARGLAVAGKRLYWSARPDLQGFGNGEIASMQLPAGPIVVATKTSSPSGIAANASTVVWADFHVGVKSMPVLDGSPAGEVTTLVSSDQSTGVWMDNDAVLWSAINTNNSVRGISLGAGHEEMVVACNQEWPKVVTADAHRVYWINRYVFGTEGRLMVGERTGGAPKVLVEGIDHPAEALTGSESTLYWSGGWNGTIMKLTK